MSHSRIRAHLNGAETEEAMEFIAEQAGHLNLNVGVVMTELSNYKLSVGFFDKQYLWSAAKTCEGWISWTAMCLK